MLVGEINKYYYWCYFFKNNEQLLSGKQFEKLDKTKRGIQT